MTPYAAFLRAVSVGGAGRLSSLVLRSLVERAGGREARALDGNGTAMFLSDAPGPAVGAGLSAALRSKFGREVPVFVRSAAQIKAALAAMPFAGADPGRVACVIHDLGPLPDPQAAAQNRSDESLATASGMLFIHYPRGYARSRLRHPALDAGTPRNLDTLRGVLSTLQAMAAAK